MLEKDILELLQDLPREQWEEARYRIIKAELHGVEDIGLCTGEEPPDVSDLAGTEEGESDTFMLDGKEITINRWFTFLGNYASDYKV